MLHSIRMLIAYCFCGGMATLMLDYDARRVKAIIEDLDKHVECDQQMTYIDASVAKIQAFCAEPCIAKNYDSIRTELGLIRSATDELMRLFREQDLVTLGVVCKKILMDFINAFTEALEEAAEMSAEERERLNEKTKKLWQNQAASHNQLLSTIRKQMAFVEMVDSTRPVSVYFAYAWTTPKYSEQECWVQPFLKMLHAELKEAGLRPIMDTENCGPGENMVRFMQQVETSQVVLLFGTRSLIAKECDTKYNNVQTELSLIARRKNRGVIPVLLSGTSRSSIPALVSTVDFFDAREYAHYAVMLETLIATIMKKIGMLIK